MKLFAFIASASASPAIKSTGCADGVHPHETDCTKFYKCSHGERWPDQNCPEGLLFNPDLLVCDWPESADPCNGKENCQAFVDNCGITPSRSNNIATTTGSPAFKVSAEVQCGETPDDWQNIIHINAGGQWDVFGDRYFALFAGADTMKFSAPLKNSGPVVNGGNFMVNYYPSCTAGEWNKYQVEQRYTDTKDTLELTMSIDDEVLVTRIVDVEDAFSGDLFVDVSNDFHDSATGFRVKNFYHQTFPES